MKFKIVVDSASDLLDGHLSHTDIGFKAVPLYIRAGGKEYVDDGKLDIMEMMDAFKADKKSGSACPSPAEYADAFAEADNVFCITLSKKLSGSYESAVLAKSIAEEAHGNKIHVFDSKLVCGAEELIVDYIVKLIGENKEFDEIVSLTDEFINKRHLYFVLKKFDNFVRTGRVSRLTGILASLIFLRPICMGENGEIKLKEKIRTARSAFKRLVDIIGETESEFKDKVCIISHCYAPEDAEELKAAVEAKYDFKEVRLKSMRGLCSFYAQIGGVIINY